MKNRRKIKIARGANAKTRGAAAKPRAPSKEIAMSDAQFDQLSGRELNELLQRVDAAIASREVAERTALREQFRAMADEAGFTLDELFGGARSGKLGKAAIKFQNPKTPAETWSGRGRMPRWLAAQLKSGAKLDDFRI